MTLDKPHTPAEFAAWLGVGERWVRKRLRTLPGVIMESRKCVWIVPRIYMEKATERKRR
jgi:hypothetical protein